MRDASDHRRDLEGRCAQRRELRIDREIDVVPFAVRPGEVGSTPLRIGDGRVEPDLPHAILDVGSFQLRGHDGRSGWVSAPGIWHCFLRPGLGDQRRGQAADQDGRGGQRIGLAGGQEQLVSSESRDLDVAIECHIDVTRPGCPRRQDRAVLRVEQKAITFFAEREPPRGAGFGAKRPCQQAERIVGGARRHV